MLDGGLDIDRLWGGAGADKFVIRKGRDIDIIQDFENGQDRLATPRGIKSVGLDQVGRKTLISSGNDVIGVLVGIRANQITITDFVSL